MQVQILIAENGNHCIVIDGVTYDMKSFVADAQRYNWLTSGRTDAEIEKLRDVAHPGYTLQDEVISEMASSYLHKRDVDQMIDARRALYQRYALYTEDKGIFLGMCLGLGFWSKLYPAGQDHAPTCLTRESAELMRKDLQLPQDTTRILMLHTKDSTYATIEECVAAGVERWDPSNG